MTIESLLPPMGYVIDWPLTRLRSKERGTPILCYVPPPPPIRHKCPTCGLVVLMIDNEITEENASRYGVNPHPEIKCSCGGMITYKKDIVES